MGTINVLMPGGHIARKLLAIFSQTSSLFGEPKIKIFSGREWFFVITDNEIEPTPQDGEKMDYIFMTAESLKKYFYHGYELDLRRVLEKYGTKDTKVIIFSCCSDCDGFVESMYSKIITEFLNMDAPVENIAKKYFADCLAVK